MNTFAQTKGGHEFLYGTMPRLAKNIDDNTKTLAQLNETLKALSKPSVIEECNVIQLQRLCTRAIEHCIAADYDFITTNYDSWDEYLMETLGSTEQEVRECGIELENLWNVEVK